MDRGKVLTKDPGQETSLLQEGSILYFNCILHNQKVEGYNLSFIQVQILGTFNIYLKHF